VVGKIRDTRTEPRANIAQVIRQTPQELEIVPLRKELPTSDLLTADKYEATIQDKLRPFVNKYPGTPEAKEVEGMIATLITEKEKVVSGQVKMNDKWLTTEEARRNEREIQAYQVRKQITDAAAKSDWVAALKVWDTLNNPDSGFADTEQYVAAVPEVSKILGNYKLELERQLAEQPIIQSRRDNSMKGMVEPDLGRVQRAIAAEVAKYKSDETLEKAAKVRWTGVYKYDAKSIQAAQKRVVEEQADIAAINLPMITEAASALSVARRYLADENAEQAELALRRVPKGSNRTIASAASLLKTKLTALKSEQRKNRDTKRIYNNTKASDTSLSTAAVAGTDDRVAAAMAASEEKLADKKSKGDDESADKSDDKPVKGKTLTAGSASRLAGTGTDGEERPRRRSSSTDSDSAPVEEDQGFLMNNLPILGGVLAVLLGLLYMQKRKGA
jgi:hypothetical protein